MSLSSIFILVSMQVGTFETGLQLNCDSDTGKLAVPWAWGMYITVKGRNFHMGFQVDSGESQPRFSALHAKYYPDDFLYQPTYFFLDHHKKWFWIPILKFKETEEGPLLT